MAKFGETTVVSASNLDNWILRRYRSYDGSPNYLAGEGPSRYV